MNGSDESLAIRNSDLDAAVQAGILNRPTADQLIAFVQNHESLISNNPDEEQVRLITGFNDIFVTIGLGLFFGAIFYLGGALFVPFIAWGLAEIFTRKRRMALPSIVLLAVFATSAAFATFSLIQGNWGSSHDIWKIAIAGLVSAGLVGLHWMRFHVPISVAAGCAALVGMVTSIAETVLPGAIQDYALPLFAPMGVALFSLAMSFDMSDRTRRTKRSDVAFWLHLLAAPLIVHPLVWNIVHVNQMTNTDALMIFILFAALSVVALVVDRRALLVSSLIYLGYALSTLLSGGSWGVQNFGLVVLAVGSIVLVLSVAWQTLRGFILGLLPASIYNAVPPPHFTPFKKS